MVNQETLQLLSPVSVLKGVGDQTVARLQKIGVRTIGELIEHYPRDYEDRRVITPIKDVVMDEVNHIVGTVVSKPEIMKKGYKIIVKFRIKDDTGSLFVVFYNQAYMKSQFVVGDTYQFYGKVKHQYNRIEIESPEYQKIGDSQPVTSQIVPLYPTTQKLSQKMVRQFIETALQEVLPQVEDLLPMAVRERYKLKSKAFALANIHFPESDDAFFEARRRLVFEELFMLQLSLYMLKSGFAQKNQGLPKKVPGDFKAFIDSLPYELTGAQKRVLREIIADMKSEYAGNRLVQGDVGSGKTVVAAVSLFVAVRNGLQGALMAPTEVLAKQHFEFLEEIFKDFEVRVALLSGSTTAKGKREILQQLREGEVDVLVGTHALIEDNVEIPNLGLVITDEQHRFGVRQRLALSDKGKTPDVVVMTATPIPRTLALILYGDMDISIIDELPPGRQPIKTNAVDTSYYPRLYAFIENQIKEGRQCYVICPMVEENEKQTELKSVTAYAEKLQDIFKDRTVGYLHGKMKPKEKNAIMEVFAKGEMDILVSTTVIEVGVNVPNATVIMIENAERFGLAQLHQLRGRVGRGKHQSYCVLVSDSKNKVTRERLKIMEKSTDGFVIADTDLKLRGPGEFFGTKQHGLPEMKIANLYTDARVLGEVQKVVTELMAEDKELMHQDYVKLKAHVMSKLDEEEIHKAL
ncbi:MAG: ATP-dependent DNA helicase RecG [Cellulosilyticaceae bacterium]